MPVPYQYPSHLETISSRPLSIYENSNILFYDSIVSQFPEETCAQRKPNQNIEIWPESPGVKSEFLYIERGLMICVAEILNATQQVLLENRESVRIGSGCFRNSIHLYI